MPTLVTTSHFEMLSPAELRSKPAPRGGLGICLLPFPIPELNRFFYTAIGGDWFWIDRLPWTYADWMKYLDRPELQTWLITEAGVPAGYFELEMQPEANVEIVYFGLLRQFVEHGLGGWALSQAVEKAWAWGARRVWVHTCDLDHPWALNNYLSRGFNLFKTETNVEDLPAKSPGPWPGARDA
ncbi:MAG: GNAT family N-acetyltransferase [Planctomycetes bacterium]|nr:GNAT family N-acetyltransferase [Planctomycetota bacterium]